VDHRRALLDLLSERGPATSICPSEVARRLTPDGDWRDLMTAVRDAGRILADEGLIEVTQKGQRVDPETARGPIRYRLPCPSEMTND